MCQGVPVMTKGAEILSFPPLVYVLVVGFSSVMRISQFSTVISLKYVSYEPFVRKLT